MNYILMRRPELRIKTSGNFDILSLSNSSFDWNLINLWFEFNLFLCVFNLSLRGNIKAIESDDGMSHTLFILVENGSFLQKAF